MSEKEEKYKRINILIRPDQYDEVAAAGLSMSGLVRDLLDDRFSDTKIVLSVTKKSKRLYDHVISNFGVGDIHLEKYLIDALDQFLADKTSEIEGLREMLKKEEEGNS